MGRRPLLRDTRAATLEVKLDAVEQDLQAALEALFVDGLFGPAQEGGAATRTLFGNPAATPADAAWRLQHRVLAGVAWSLLFLAITAPLAIARFKQRTTE